MITRRQMLARMLGGSVALAAADIWLPGERSIFLPGRAPIFSCYDVQVRIEFQADEFIQALRECIEAAGPIAYTQAGLMVLSDIARPLIDKHVMPFAVTAQRFA